MLHAFLHRKVALPVLVIGISLTGVQHAAAGVDAGSVSLRSEKSADTTDTITVFQQADLVRTGYTRLGPALAALLPALSLRQAATLNGEDHVPLASLRGFAPDQMVVLVNGKRRHAAAMFHTEDAPGQGSPGVDLDAVPLSALSRVEVALGAVGGRFGGDALGGVINLVLDDSASGGHLRAQYGQRRTTMDGVPKLNQTTVDNGSGSISHVTGGSRVIDDGDGDSLNLSGSWGFDLTERGFMRVSAGYWADDSSNRSGFDERQQYPLQANGDFDIRESTVSRLTTSYGQPDRDELNIQFNAGVHLNDEVELYGFTALSTRNSKSAAGYYRPLDAEALPELYPNGLLPLIKTDIDDRSFTVGARGNAWDWNWDFSYGVMNSEIDWKVRDSLNPTYGALSPLTFNTGNTESDLEAFNFDFGRNLLLFERAARVNVGIEYRLDKYEVERGEGASYLDAGAADPARLPLPAGSVGYAGFPEEVGVDRYGTGIYADLRMNLSERLSAYGAARVDDFDGFDTMANGQLSLAYQIDPAWQVRLGISGGDRVPGIAQQSYARSTTTLTTGGPVESGVYLPDSTVAAAFGVDGLEAESTFSVSAGVEYAPGGAFSFRIDVYQTQVDDRVVLADAQAFGSPAGTARFVLNGADVQHRGVDAQGAWSTTLGSGELDLTLGISVTDIEADSTGASDALFGATALDQLATAWPESRIILSGNWRRGRFDLNTRVTGYGSTEDQTTNGGQGQKIDAAWILDADVLYQATPVVAFSIGVNNLLDSYPDTLPREAGAPDANHLYPYSNFSPYGFEGRLLYARVLARFE
ncbi:MAG: TonB-dependent receptor [Pseudomonadales bacterium]|nr:TonB-dependent receptor [Pseudomonadales bacterium]